MLAGERTGLVELGGVQGDGLLAQDVLACGEGRAEVANVGVVRRRDVDGVDLGVRAELLERVVDALDAMGGREGVGLGARAVLDAVDRAAREREGLRHLVRDDAAAHDGPFELGRIEDVRRERLVFDRGEGGLCGGGGIKRGGCGTGHGNSL